MKRLLTRLDALQQRRPRLALPLAVFKRFGEHGGGRLGANISYWSFFSIFPLLLAFVTVLNIVLKNRPGTRQDLVDGALGQVPVIGTQLADSQHALGGSWITIAVGIAAALWTGVAAVNALQVALDEVWDVPMFRRPNGAMQRAKALAFLGVLALGIGVSVFAANLAAILDLAAVVGALGLAVTFVVNGATLMFTFWLLTTGPNSVRSLLPGTVFGAVGLLVLQVVGSWIVQRYINGASDTYGTFAVVIALLSWFYLLSRVVLYSAELNAVLAHHLSPRSMVAESGLTAADLRAAEFDAQRVQRDERLDVNVS